MIYGDIHSTISRSMIINTLKVNNTEDYILKFEAALKLF